MPTRLLRDGILTSDRVNQLDDAAEVFYRRLHSIVDDFGCCDARPAILRTALYPLKIANKSEDEIITYVCACMRAGLVDVYTCKGKPYLQVRDFRQQQRSKPKCPLTSEADCVATVSNCKQLLTVVYLDVVEVEVEVEVGSPATSLRSVATISPSVVPEKQDQPPMLVNASKGGARKKKTEVDGTLTSAVWSEYSTRYVDRYGIMPVRNAKVNSQLKQFVARVGADEAPHIAGWYVGHNKAWYVGKGHTIAVLLADAEMLRTEWATNRPTTQTQARQADETATRGNVFSRLLGEHDNDEDRRQSDG